MFCSHQPDIEESNFLPRRHSRWYLDDVSVTPQHLCFFKVNAMFLLVGFTLAYIVLENHGIYSIPICILINNQPNSAFAWLTVPLRLLFRVIGSLLTARSWCIEADWQQASDKLQGRKPRLLWRFLDGTECWPTCFLVSQLLLVASNTVTGTLQSR